MFPGSFLAHASHGRSAQQLCQEDAPPQAPLPQAPSFAPMAGRREWPSSLGNARPTARLEVKLEPSPPP
eukprot:676079-Alexandrium_andersonii.AAC.1